MPFVYHRVIKVAKEFVGQLTFAVSNKGEFSHEIEEFGGTKEEVFLGIFGNNGMKYTYGEKKFRFGVCTVKLFLSDSVHTQCDLLNCFCLYIS